MPKLASYNGKVDSIENIKVSPMSRAFLFSDSVYEVISFYKNEFINCSVKKDDISITGSTINPNGGVKIKTFGDHRIAMSFKIMNLICDKQLSFDDLECINISYPDFNKHLNSLKVENGL